MRMVERMIKGHQPLDKMCIDCIYKQRAEDGGCDIKNCPLLKGEAMYEKIKLPIIRL